MAADVRKTGLLSKLSQRVAKAHEAHKNDETKYGMVDLPPGIKGGIARLAMCKLDEYKEDKAKTGIKKGDVYVVFRGIAVTPDKHDGVQVKGQGVMLSIPLTDTLKTKDGVVTTVTFEEHWAELLNELRKLGLNTSAIPWSAIEATLASLEKSKPLYRFSTRGWTPPASKTEPNPKEMTFVQFDGVVSEEEAAVADSVAPSSGFAAPESGGSGDDSGDVPDGAIGDPGNEDFDLISTAAEAEKGDPQSIENMKEQARKWGISDQEIEDSGSWDNLANDGTSLREMIEAKMTGGDAEEPSTEPEAAWEPKVGATCNYQIKAGGKVHQVKIDKIDAKAKTADLSNIADKGKTKYPKVPLVKLSAA